MSRYQVFLMALACGHEVADVMRREFGKQCSKWPGTGKDAFSLVTPYERGQGHSHILFLPFLCAMINVHCNVSLFFRFFFAPTTTMLPLIRSRYAVVVLLCLASLAFVAEGSAGPQQESGYEPVPARLDEGEQPGDHSDLEEPTSHVPRKLNAYGQACSSGNTVCPNGLCCRGTDVCYYDNKCGPACTDLCEISGSRRWCCAKNWYYPSNCLLNGVPPRELMRCASSDTAATNPGTYNPCDNRPSTTNTAFRRMCP